MMVLRTRNLDQEYNGTPVLSDVSLEAAEGERLGVVGSNGSGKSTLLRLLAGELQPTGGEVQWMPRVTRGYLCQQGHWKASCSLGEQMQQVPAELLSRCGVTEEMLRRPAAALSGGQKVRAALARVLALRPQVLLLDEPTNHLDAAGLEWLEEVLASYRGTVVVVSHDRYFLDQLATAVLEVDGGRARRYPGNYTAYARQKEAEVERAWSEYRAHQNEKRHLEEAMRRQLEWARQSHERKVPRELKVAKAGFKAQAKAMMRRAKAISSRLERMHAEKPHETAGLRLRLDGGVGVGPNLVLATDLGFSYDARHWLFRKVGFFLQRGDRLAVIGPNGCGKTTLLRLILGQLRPTEGSLYVAPAQIAYLAQELDTLDPRHTVLQEAAGSSAPDQPHIRSLLGCLLFSGEAVAKPVCILSRGEKIRLALAKTLLTSPDLLVLDEPTNGLDLPSREAVEEALEGFPGTIILVSHDRYLLRRRATRVMNLEGGVLTVFPGSYEEYLERGFRPEAPGRTGTSPGAADSDRRLVLETRLAQLSAALDAPPEGQAERLQQEFLAVSRELRTLNGLTFPTEN